MDFSEAAWHLIVGGAATTEGIGAEAFNYATYESCRLPNDTLPTGINVIFNCKKLVNYIYSTKIEAHYEPYSHTSLLLAPNN